MLVAGTNFKTMAHYKCTNSFTSSRGKRFSYGEKISSYDFNALPYADQRNFTRYEEESSSSLGSRSSSDSSSSFFSSPSIDFSSSYSSSSSSSDFSGFGGGDSGGGGASGDW
jgi:hypothetical protein